jgi:hypothetical protein
MTSLPGGPAAMTDYVERLNERMSPYYEFTASAQVWVSALDFDKPLDLSTNPFRISWKNGAYELLAEPYLEDTTDVSIDLATILLGASDAAGIGEDAPVSVVDFVAAIRSLADKLLEDHVGKVLVLLPFEFRHPFWPAPVAGRIRAYRDALALAIPTWSVPVSYLDLYHWFDPSIHTESALFGLRGYPNQIAHNRIAVEVGRYIRQSTHYLFAQPGGPGVTEPFVEWEDYQEPDPV